MVSKPNVGDSGWGPTLNAALDALDITNPASAAAVAANGTYQPLIGSLEGVPVTFYGHSYGRVPGVACTPGAEWPKRVATRLRSGTTNYRAIAGSRLFDVSFAAFSSAGFVPNDGSGEAASVPWVPGTGGLVVVEGELNDVESETKASHAAYQAGWLNTLKMLLCTLSSGQIIQDTAAACTYTGAWTANAATFPSGHGGSVHYTSAQNAKVDVAFTLPAGVTQVWLPYVIADASNPQAQFSVKIDGTTVDASVNGTGGMETYTGFPLPNQSFAWGVRMYSGLSAGAHTLTITKTDASANLVIFSALLIPSATPPKILVLKDPGNLSAAWATAQAAGLPATYDGLIDTAVALFPNALAASLRTGSPSWVPATMCAAVDSVHPNDAGMDNIASQVVAALRSQTFAAGLNTV